MTPRWLRFMEVAFLTVLVFAVLWKGGKSLEATWIVMGVAGVMAFMYWSRRNTNDQAPMTHVPFALWLPLILFVLWAGVTYVFSETRNYGLDEVLRDGALVLVFLWTYRMMRGDAATRMRFMQRFLSVMLWTTFIACGIGVLIYVLQPVDRFVGTFFDFRFHTDYWPNAWAEYLLLAWPLVLLWIVRQRMISSWLLVTGFSLLGFMLGCLLLSYSRGALIAFGGQSILLLLLSLPSVRQWWKRGVAPFGIVVASALVTFAAANILRSQFFPVQSVGEKIRFASAEGTSSIDERAQFWEQAWKLSKEEPLFGFGPYSFRFVQPRLQQHVLATSDHPHNVFLKLLVERGWIGMILFAWIVVYVLAVAGVPLIHSIRKYSPERALPFVAVLGVLAHSLIDYNLQFVGIALPFWILLAILAGSLVTKIRSVPIPVMRIAEVLLAGVLLIAAVHEGRFLVLSSLGRHSEAAGRVDEALAWYDRSDGEWFSRDMHLSRVQLLIKEKSYSEASIGLDTYEKENALDGRSAFLRGRILLDQGDAAAALASFVSAFQRIGWNDLGPLGNILNSLRALDDRQLLEEWRPVLRERLTAFGDAILQNTHFVALSRNVEEYESITGVLQTVFPGDISVDVRTRVLDHALEERARFSERPPGFLW